MKEDARQVRTRAALHRAMLDLISRAALEAITIRQIAAQAGIGYATFFRHYASKEALLEAAAAGEIRRLVDLTLPVMDRTSLRASCLALCRYIDAHRPLWKALLAGQAQQTMRQELTRISIELAQTRATGWPPQDVAIRVTVGAMVEILGWWMQADAVPTEEVARLLDEVAISPSMSPRRVAPHR